MSMSVTTSWQITYLSCVTMTNYFDGEETTMEPTEEAVEPEETTSEETPDEEVAE